MKVVCISGKAQHGKDTLAQFLLEAMENQNKSVLIFHYADLLKYLCTKYFGWNGVKDETGRALLQRLGTDIVRFKEPNYWVNFAVGFLKLFEDEWDYVLIPDCRFPNEVFEMKRAGFDTRHIRIRRPNFDNGLTEEQQKHPSETALDNYPCDTTVVNDEDLEYLKLVAYSLERWLECDV